MTYGAFAPEQQQCSHDIFDCGQLHMRVFAVRPLVSAVVCESAE
jgi:hypothetical protein